MATYHLGMLEAVVKKKGLVETSDLHVIRNVSSK